MGISGNVLTNRGDVKLENLMVLDRSLEGAQGDPELMGRQVSAKWL